MVMGGQGWSEALTDDLTWVCWCGRIRKSGVGKGGEDTHRFGGWRKPAKTRKAPVYPKKMYKNRQVWMQVGAGGCIMGTLEQSDVNTSNTGGYEHVIGGGRGGAKSKNQQYLEAIESKTTGKQAQAYDIIHINNNQTTN